MGLGKPLAHQFSLSILEPMMCSREGGCSLSTRNILGLLRNRVTAKTLPLPADSLGLVLPGEVRSQSPESTEQNSVGPAFLPQPRLLSLSCIHLTQSHTSEAISS